MKPIPSNASLTPAIALAGLLIYRCQSQVSCAAIEKWEEEGIFLANTLTSYLESCLYLERRCFGVPTNSKALVSRIDSALSTTHEMLSRQLAQSRSSLAKTRNRITSTLFAFPTEVLSEIFLHVVYAPIEQDDDNSSPMASELQAIYKRLHNLVGVCSVWRTVATQCGTLWAVIPMVDPRLKIGPAQHLATALSLQRAGDQLHLAILTGGNIRVDSLENYTHRLRTVNIRAETNWDINYLLSDLLGRGELRLLSELSIYQQTKSSRLGTGGNNHAVPLSHSYIFTTNRTSQRNLLSLLTSISVLRISGALLRWNEVMFSTQLVELRLHKIVLGHNSALLDFLEALSSARGIRELRVLSVVAFPDITTTRPQPFFSLPELKLLSLENLDYNVMGTLLKSVAPGTHRLRIWLTETCRVTYESNGTQHAVNREDLYELLRPVKVDTLMLQRELGEDHWITPRELRELLSSMPRLKLLMMNNWEFERETWEALVQPSQKDPLPFPKLAELRLTWAKFYDVERIENMMRSHPLENFFIGANVDTDDGDEELFQVEHKELAMRLKSFATNVYFADCHVTPPEFKDAHWRLW